MEQMWVEGFPIVLVQRPRLQLEPCHTYRTDGSAIVDQTVRGRWSSDTFSSVPTIRVGSLLGPFVPPTGFFCSSLGVAAASHGSCPWVCARSYVDLVGLLATTEDRNAGRYRVPRTGNTIDMLFRVVPS